MNQPAVIDYIVVGQGLAGSAIAVQLLKRGKKIAVFDKPDENVSSRVAAGIFNPITGKKAIRTWQCDTVFPYLHRYYPEVESLTGAKFFTPASIYRPFAAVHEQNDWMAKSADAHYAAYIEEVRTTPGFADGIHDPFGGLVIRQGGYLNTNVYMESVRAMVRARAVAVAGTFREHELRLTSDGVAYGDFQAGRVIFCEGERALRNQWFEGLPIRPLKGETLTIKTDWKKHVIVNRGVYLVPGEKEGYYRVGSTYKGHDISPSATQEGLHELKGKLDSLVSFSYEVISQEWGIRPTTIDRRPLLGKHPQHERLVIFNGLGTKGVSLAPYFSEVLVCWLENNGPLNRDVDLSRYY